MSTKPTPHRVLGPLRAKQAALIGGVALTLLAAALTTLIAALGSCASKEAIRVGEPLKRRGDEIVVAGRYFHTGAPVVLWTDPGGYDAYRTEYRFEPFENRRYDAKAKPMLGPQRYNLREAGLTDEELELVRGGGWPLDLLREQIDQFVLHYDVCGVSRRCFRVLHDVRGLSVHFMLDIDGTIYQTLDVKERAWHAGHANTRSIGIEIANIGAYPPDTESPLEQWYGKDEDGEAIITLPSWVGDGGIRTPGFVGRPARPEPIRGRIHGETYEMYDLTPEQYDSLIKLTAALCTIFPKLECDYPRDADGELITTTLPEDAYESFSGIVGHFHLTEGKIDPGPALQWDRLVHEARAIMRGSRRVEPFRRDFARVEAD